MRVRTVAALFVDPRGPYPGMVGVESWDAARDARTYDGPYSVVAHPPCGPWAKLKHIYQGREHDCALIALEQVRRWGGVLEHPADSMLWSVFGDDPNPKRRGSQYMARPGEPPDCWLGYTIEVTQVEWGHVARKRTWLYLVGVPQAVLGSPPFPGRSPTHWISGTRSNRRKPIDRVPSGIKVCSAQQRRRTPQLFAEYLVRLARSVP